MIIWVGTGGNSGGWYTEINQAGMEGASSASTQVAGIGHSDQSGGSYGPASAEFIVPSGWYWEVTNSATSKSVTGTVNRIEQWQL